MAGHSEGKDIYERTATLEVHMRTLMGNGQPGLVEKMERKLDRLMWGLVILFFATLGSQHGADVLKWFVR